MFDKPTILNLHFLLRDSYIAVWMAGRHRTDGRRTGAVTHLALLGVKIVGSAFSGKHENFSAQLVMVVLF